MSNALPLPETPPPPPAVTVGISTKDRPEALVRALRSLRHLEGVIAEAIVVDDGSATPVEGPALAALAADLPPDVRFIRHDASRSLAASRNRIAREARTPWVLKRLTPGWRTRRFHGWRSTPSVSTRWTDAT